MGHPGSNSYIPPFAVMLRRMGHPSFRGQLKRAVVLRTIPNHAIKLHEWGTRLCGLASAFIFRRWWWPGRGGIVSGYGDLAVGVGGTEGDKGCSLPRWPMEAALRGRLHILQVMPSEPM